MRSSRRDGAGAEGRGWPDRLTEEPTDTGRAERVRALRHRVRDGGYRPPVDDVAEAVLAWLWPSSSSDRAVAYPLARAS